MIELIIDYLRKKKILGPRETSLNVMLGTNGIPDREVDLVLVFAAFFLEAKVEEEMWIPLTDAHKPKNMQWVHAVVEEILATGKKRRWLVTAQYTNGYGLVVDQEINGWAGFGNYHEGDDEYYAPEGFYEQETTHSETLFALEDDQKVIFWRPLLKFPKA